MGRRRLTAILAVVLLRLNPALADGDAQQQTTAAATGVTAPAAPPGDPQQATAAATDVTAPAAAPADLDEIVVHGIRRGDLILPTTVTSPSAYGLGLSVMD